MVAGHLRHEFIFHVRTIRMAIEFETHQSRMQEYTIPIRLLQVVVIIICSPGTRSFAI